MSSGLLQERVEFISEHLPALGETLLQMQEGSLDIKTKSNSLDLVTSADKESERVLVELIRNRFPNDSILAEEGSQQTGSDHFQWVIDPIDGTINYSHGLPLFAISIGICFDSVPSAGVIYLPAFGWLYSAVTGKGATKTQWVVGTNHKKTKQIRVSETNQINSTLVVTGFPYNRRSILEKLLSGIRNVLLDARGIRRTGSAAIDLAWVAEGHFDAHYEISLNPWDTCAGVVLVREAGGRVTDISGNDYLLSHPSLCASNGKVHDEMIRLIEPLRK